jgi:hypothetical protein
MEPDADYPTAWRETAVPRSRYRKPRRAFPGTAGLPPRQPTARRLWPAMLALGLLIGNRPVLAESVQQPSVIHLTGPDQSLDADLVLLCPQGSITEPRLQNPKTGKVFPISDPRLRAVAVKACSPGAPTAAEGVSVSVTNSGTNPIYVAFSVGTIGSNSPGPIAWASGCTVSSNQATIPAGQTCQATVPSDVGTSRFCAFTTPQSPPKANCFLAQSVNQTMVETTFGDASNNYCYPNSMSSCVWYDISVIPSSCTDEAWTANQCANTGGAAYNLPVSLACSNEPTYVCQGPKNNNYGTAMYPSNCGKPDASCVPPASGVPAPLCNNAYFHPTPVPSPNAECLSGETLTINFLSGP